MVLSLLMDCDPYGALDCPDADGRLRGRCPGRPPKRASSRPRPMRPATAVPPDVAGQFWKREHSREIKFGRSGIVSIIERAGPPDEELTVGRRVAITEFSVEFVDVQFQNPFGHPTMINSSPAQVPCAGPAWHRAERRWHEANADVDRPIKSRCRRPFVTSSNDICEKYGLIIVPQTDVTASAGYAKLKPRPSVSSSWAHFLKPVTTDTGVVLRTHTVAAPGLGVATCGSAALASAESEIKRETGADVVMAVKLRVGTYHQKAALEQNSSIRWTAANSSITLTAQKSLVSDSDVTDASRLITCRLANRAGPHEPIRPSTGRDVAGVYRAGVSIVAGQGGP